MANAVHIAKKAKGGGSTHAVGLGDLRVMILQDGDVWYAQGLEIDYLAQGSSQALAQKSFERGLELTVLEHLKLFGNIHKLLKPAQPETWKEFFQHATSEQCKFSTFQTHALKVNFGETMLIASTDRPKAKPGSRAKGKEVVAKNPPRKQSVLPFDRIAYLACA